ncbi:MAG: hypothetical protein HKN31_01275, partial [Pricia sp.]|nr:hypothetical protein [Pricia sp.]
MRCFCVFAFLVFFSFPTLSSQKTNHIEPYWEMLFKNRRQEALTEFQKKRKDDISGELIQEILKAENGTFSNPDGFIEKINSYPNFEYYLYALWNQNFFFDTYLKTGFNKKNSKNINGIALNRVKNTTIKESLRYLKSVVAQHNADWETYFHLNSEIPSIKSWQFCGSFENLNGSGLATEYGPEKNSFSEMDFNANSNGLVNWYTLEGRENEAYQYYSNHSEYGSAVNYAQTFIDNPQDRTAVIRLGSSALAKIWLNDVLVFENGNDGITDMDAYNVAVKLPKGHNRLLVKNADKSGIAYFIVRITDKAGQPFNDLKFRNTYTPYNESTLESLSPEAVSHPVESFFLNRVKKDPNNFFDSFCLFNAYLRNSKYTEAKTMLLPLLKRYPNSSFLRKYLIEIYNQEKDYASAKELQKNIEQDDTEYFLSYLYRFQDTKALFKLPIPEFEQFVQEFSASTDLEIIKASADLLLHIRKEDKTALKQSLKSIITEHNDQLEIVKIYLNLYISYLNEEDKAIKILEDINQDYFDYSALKSLARLYDKQNKKDRTLELFEDQYARVSYDNIFLSDYIAYLHKNKKYTESLPYIDQLLSNFP